MNINTTTKYPGTQAATIIGTIALTKIKIAILQGKIDILDLYYENNNFEKAVPRIFKKHAMNHMQLISN